MRSHFFSNIKILDFGFRGLRLLLRMICFSYQSENKKYKDKIFIFIKILKLYIKEGYTPEESYQFGFLSNTFDYRMVSKFASRKKMSQIQRKINPPSWSPLTEDKDIFYRICENFAIPTPKLYAIVFKDTPSWTFKGQKIHNRKEWCEFSVKYLPEEFVIKPARGVYGTGVKIFNRKDESFIDELKMFKSPVEIYDEMIANKFYSCFVVQERMHNHFDFKKLSKTEYLQTIRVITNFDSYGNCRIICAYLKPIVGKNIVDNQNYGRTGNLLARIDLSNGTIQRVIFLSNNPPGIDTIKKHPDSGYIFSEFTIPCWKDVCEISINCAKKFLPIQAIGWDIAVTQNGPVIIEGNIWFDPPKFGDMDKILLELEK